MNQNSQSVPYRFIFLLIAFLLLSSSLVSFPALAGLSSSSQSSATTTNLVSTSGDGALAQTTQSGILGAVLPGNDLTDITSGSAIIWTDQTSYPPESIVTIYGTGFLVDSTIYLTVTEPNSTLFSWTTGSDANGDFTTYYQLDALNGNYTVVASDGTNSATTWFLDPPNLNLAPSQGPTGTSTTLSGSGYSHISTYYYCFESGVTSPTVCPTTLSFITSSSGQIPASTTLVISGSTGLVVVSHGTTVDDSAPFTITVPVLTILPNAGPVNTITTLTGSGYAPGGTYLYCFESGASSATSCPGGSPTFTAVSSGINAGKIPTTPTGTILTIPTSSTTGLVVVSQGSTVESSQTFTVTIASLGLTPNNGPSGTTTILSGSGYAPSYEYDYCFDSGISSPPTTFTCSPSSPSFTSDVSGNIPPSESLAISGSTGYVLVVDPTSHAVVASAKFTIATPVSQPVTITTADSALSATITVSGCDVSPTTLTANGIQASLTADPSCTLTFTVPSDGTNLRYRFSSSGTPSTTWTVTTCATGTCSLATNTVYHQVQNTFSVTIDGGNPGSEDTIMLTGTFLGSSSTSILTLDVAGVSSASDTAWTDYDTSVTFPATSTLSGSSERWAINGVYTTSLLTTGGGTYSQTYYHQSLQTLSYSLSDSSTPTPPTFTANQFGSPYGPSLTMTATGYWFDAGSLWTVTNPLTDSDSSQRWQLNQADSGTISSAQTTVFAYYHQFMITFGYADQDTSTITSGATIGSYEQFGGSNTITAGTTYGSTSPTSDWVDAGTEMVSYQTYTAASGTERWALSSSPENFDVSSSATISESSYHHQFQLEVTVSPSAVGVSNVGRNPSGSDCSAAPPIDTVSCWYDSRTSVTLTAANNVVISPTLYIFSGWSGDLTGTTNPNSIDMNAAHSVTANYDEYASGAGLVTDQSGCGFTVDNSNPNAFRLIFTQDPANPTYYKLSASNPGQFGYNIFAVGTSGDSVSLTIEIPYPFVTQGSNPIQVYSAVSLSSNGCFVPSSQTSATIGVTSGITTPSGAAGIGLGTYGTTNLPTDTSSGSLVTITINGNIPSSGLFYVEIHLDYGLKPTSSTYFGGYTQSDACGSPSNLDAVSSPSTSTSSPICNLGEYEFFDTGTVSSTPISDSQTIINENDFKHDPGIAGLVLDSNGTPIQGAHVTVTGPNGLSCSTTTDQDGFFSCQFKWTGKAASFTTTVSYESITQSQTITLKANGFAFLTFNFPITLQ